MGDRGEKNDSVYLVLRLKSRRDGEVSHVSVCVAVCLWLCGIVAVWHCACQSHSRSKHELMYHATNLMTF